MNIDVRGVAVTSLAAAGLLVAVAAPASAQATGPKCVIATSADPTGEGWQTQTGFIEGGPLVADQPGATIGMKCSIQVGPAGATHAGADCASAATTPSLQVTWLPPTMMACGMPQGQAYLCTEIWLNGVTYYWDDTNAAWSASNTVDCATALFVCLPPPLDFYCADPTISY